MKEPFAFGRLAMLGSESMADLRQGAGAEAAKELVELHQMQTEVPQQCVGCFV